MKENGSSGKSAGKVTAHALDWWRESTAGKLVAPVTCALYEVFFLTRYVSTLPDGAVSTPTALLGLLALTTACTAGVFFRYRTALAPFVVVTLEAVLTLASDVTFLTIVPLGMTSCHDTSNVITIGRGGRTRIVERVVTKRLDGIDDEKGTGGLVDGHDGSSHMWLTPQW